MLAARLLHIHLEPELPRGHGARDDWFTACKLRISELCHRLGVLPSTARGLHATQQNSASGVQVSVERGLKRRILR